MGPEFNLPVDLDTSGLILDCLIMCHKCTCGHCCVGFCVYQALACMKVFFLSSTFQFSLLFILSPFCSSFCLLLHLFLFSPLPFFLPLFPCFTPLSIKGFSSYPLGPSAPPAKYPHKSVYPTQKAKHTLFIIPIQP